MSRIPVDEFFKMSVIKNYDYDIERGIHVKSLTFDEAEEIYGISTDQQDLKREKREKDNETEN